MLNNFLMDKFFKEQLYRTTPIIVPAAYINFNSPKNSGVNNNTVV